LSIPRQRNRDCARLSKKKNHNTVVILENVKPEDTEGIKAQGSPPDEIQYLNDVELRRAKR